MIYHIFNHRFTTLIAVALFFLANFGIALAETEKKETKNIAIVKGFLNDVVNEGKADLIDKYWAQDLVWHGASLGEVHGREVYKKGLLSARDSFSKMHLEIKDIIAQGDKVVV